jgi:multimeric flavodoxin WrbA
MNVLGISGSPFENGSTSFSVKYALNEMEKKNKTVKYISLSKKNINFCKGCWSCTRTGKCIQKDDMEDILTSLIWADAVILGSPVYFGMVSGQMKTMMDRCVLLRTDNIKKYLLTAKIGCGIACGGFRNGGQETTLQNIHTFLLQQNMKVINDGYEFCHAGGAIVGTAEKDTVGLKTISNMMHNLDMMLG